MKRFFIFTLIVLGLLVPSCAIARELLYNPERIKVYIPPKNSLTVMMEHAFADWQRHLGDKIKFDYVGTKSTANIEVVFVNKDISKICGGDNTIGCNGVHYAGTTRGNAKRVDSKLYISMLDNKNRPMTRDQIYTIMLHEIGHSLGLDHSYNKSSIMYYENRVTNQEIRQEDVDNVLKLYGLK